MTACWQRPEPENPLGEPARGTTVRSAIPSVSMLWDYGND